MIIIRYYKHDRKGKLRKQGVRQNKEDSELVRFKFENISRFDVSKIVALIVMVVQLENQTSHWSH